MCGVPQPRGERHVDRKPDRRLYRGWVAGLVRIFEQHLQGAGDRADERSGQRRRAYLVEPVRECRGQVPGDLALRVELDLQGAPAHRWHGAHQAQPQRAEFLFDDTIVAMRQDEHGVEVTFDRAAPRRFDLVVGTDGLHSAVRRLAFGPERDFVRHLGVYIATMPLGDPVDHPHDILMYNTPGRLVTIHPSRGDALVAFIFRGAEIAGFDYRDTQQHKRTVTDAYAGVGWRVPELR